MYICFKFKDRCPYVNPTPISVSKHGKLNIHIVLNYKLQQ
jgi:hypothetical protein